MSVSRRLGPIVVSVMSSCRSVESGFLLSLTAFPKSHSLVVRGPILCIGRFQSPHISPSQLPGLPKLKGFWFVCDLISPVAKTVRVRLSAVVAGVADGLLRRTGLPSIVLCAVPAVENPEAVLLFFFEKSGFIVLFPPTTGLSVHARFDDVSPAGDQVSRFRGRLRDLQIVYGACIQI